MRLGSVGPVTAGVACRWCRGGRLRGYRCFYNACIELMLRTVDAFSNIFIIGVASCACDREVLRTACPIAVVNLMLRGAGHIWQGFMAGPQLFTSLRGG